jgi:hypothetical protein
MAKASGPTEPSRPTVKRLFALSGNRCAFPECSTRLVERDTGSVVGEVCHIKGEKPTAPRFDQAQSNEERHGFGNLILLCNVHHKVIDDNPQTYPIERLLKMKEDHETRLEGKEPVDEKTAETFVSAAVTYFIHQGSVIHSPNQSGGQVAHTITNYYQAPNPDDEPVRVEGKVSLSAGLELIQHFGCPGLLLTVICRSKRPAKLRRAMLCLTGKGIIAALQAGFGHSFAHTPFEALPEEEMAIDLFPLQQRNAPEGYVLQRDDAARFYFPMLAGPLGLFLSRPAEALSLRVQFFDESEQAVCGGEDVKRNLEGLVEIARQGPFTAKFGTVKMTVKANSTEPPDLSALGRVNPNPVDFRSAGAEGREGKDADSP